jgi:hypothetical protein
MRLAGLDEKNTKLASSETLIRASCQEKNDWPDTQPVSKVATLIACQFYGGQKNKNKKDGGINTVCVDADPST